MPTLASNPLSKKTKPPYVWLIVLFGLLGTALWMIIIPYNDANDEYLHYGLARFIADEHRLPVYNTDDYIQTYCVQKKYFEFGELKTQSICQGSYSIFPFPSYLISALFIAPIPQDASYRYLFARLPNLLYAALFLLLAWGIIRRLFESRITQILSLASIAFIPQIMFINAYTNSDGFSLVVGAFVIYVWARLLREGPTRQNILLGALSLGLLASAKYNYFALFPATALLLVLSFKIMGVKNLLRFLGASVLGVMLISGFWYVRNFMLYGDALGFVTVLRTVNALAPDRITAMDSGHTIWTILLTTNWSILSFQSFFATFGWMTLYLPNVVYLVLLVFITLAFFGWIFSAVNRIAEKKVRAWIGSPLFPFYVASACAIIGSISLSLWTSLTNDFQPQGRYLFPALLPILLGIIAGLQRFAKMIQLGERWILTIFAGWMGVLWIFSAVMLIVYYKTIRNDLTVLENFQSYDAHFFSSNNMLTDSLVLVGSILVGIVLWKIWKSILEEIHVSEPSAQNKRSDINS